MALEADIEKSLLEKLKDLKYSCRDDIRDKASLEKNFRGHFEKLNKVKLSDAEFSRLQREIIKPNVFEAARILRERSSFQREDGKPLHYTLVNIKDWCKNEFEVIHQLKINTEYSYHRYDVLLLINGLPVVQIELKSLDVAPKAAMEQIVRYKNDPGSGYTNSLLCFIQLFIVTNESSACYFSNNEKEHFQFNADERSLPIYQHADRYNRKITHLHDFAESFLTKCALGELISRYMALVASEKKLMIMRPYQIYAVKTIVDCIHENRGNGYIWHTTGSGKTLTSFKASTLLKDSPEVEKCLFVVDRKDLDRQTRQEFNRFQEGCVEENTDTASLVERLLSNDYANKVIVCTIQKLGLALQGSNRQQYRRRLKKLRDKRIVFIFDECHRSQFGENHRAIIDFFPNAQLFGFTGTPIFEENAAYRQIEGERESFKTTKDLFQKELHAYTITDAIDDGNVLRFHIDYFKSEGNPAPNPGDSLSKKAVVEAILKRHDAVTAERKFNAILASASINDAIEYHKRFGEIQREWQEQDEAFRPLNIVCLFSPPAEGDKEIKQIQEDLPQEKEDNSREPHKKRAALKAIIADYNQKYGSNHSIENFDRYYEDIQKRIKDQQYPNQDYPHSKKIDIAIVVDMLLTGFDSKYLNTLYVDKKLRYHSLIQAFSRTNRTLNSTKPYGHVLDFRCQEEKVDEAIALFSGKERNEAKEIWLVDSAPKVIEKFETEARRLHAFMESQGLPCLPEQVANLKGAEARIQYLSHIKEIQRLKRQLDQYTELDAKSRERIEKAMPEEQLRSHRGAYLSLAQNFKEYQASSDAGEVLRREVDFELVLFNSAIIDYDYIMKLISSYTGSGPQRERMNREQLLGIIKSDSKFISEHEEIEAYITTLETGKALDKEEIINRYEIFKKEKLAKDVASLAERHGVRREALKVFVDNISVRRRFEPEKLDDLMEPLELAWRDKLKKRAALMKDLTPLLRKLVRGREIRGLAAYEN